MGRRRHTLDHRELYRDPTKRCWADATDVYAPHNERWLTLLNKTHGGGFWVFLGLWTSPPPFIPVGRMCTRWMACATLSYPNQSFELKDFRRFISLVSSDYISRVGEDKEIGVSFKRSVSLSRPIKRFGVLFCFRGSRWLIRDKDYVYFAGVCVLWLEIKMNVFALVFFLMVSGLMCLLNTVSNKTTFDTAIFSYYCQLILRSLW